LAKFIKKPFSFPGTREVRFYYFPKHYQLTALHEQLV